MDRVLIVEDDKNLNRGIKLALQQNYFCLQAFSVEMARGILQAQGADLVLLDVNLPDANGMEFLREIRSSSRLPVILLTANKMEMDIVSGLELGANDYITKPFSLMVLRARVEVQLRDRRPADRIFRVADFYFDFDRMEYWKGSEPLILSKTEQRLLYCLVEQKGKTVSRAYLIDTVWQGETEFVEEHALTVAINRLRSKLGEKPNQPSFIKTIYGIGYIWTEGEGKGEDV